MTTETKEIKNVKKTKKPAGVTVTLCMIVKDETHIIKDCLNSMLPYIDRYDITDTGSTDGTPEMIEEFMEEYGIPGEVYRSDWKGFGDSPKGIGSRTESLRNCDGKADYCWVIDADDYVDGKFDYPKIMDQDCYSLQIKRGEFVWWRNQIFKTGLGWHYEGILHEYAACDKQNHTGLRIGGSYGIEARTLGARNVGVTPQEKYSADAELLEDALNNEESPHYDPTNARYQFYLAQSYFDCQKWDKSFESYSKRVTMGGWEEEVYYSLFRLGVITSIQNKPWTEIQQRFLQAWNYRPIRSEPLYQIARLYRGSGQPRLCNAFAKLALDIPLPPHDILFISHDVYKWQALDEFASTCYYLNDFGNGYNACKHLLEKCDVPESEKNRIMTNLKEYEKKVKEQHAAMPQEMKEQIQEETAKRTKREVNMNKKGTKVNQGNKRGKQRKKKK